MSCPLCGFRFSFQDPFGIFDVVKCAKCEKESYIPDAIIEEFAENVEFMEYINNRGGGPVRPPLFQPPIY